MIRKINFNKNKLINSVLVNYYNTFSHMLDTADYVPDYFNNKISKYIFKNMKKSFKLIDKEDKKFQKEFIKKQIAKEKSINIQNRLKNKNEKLTNRIK